MEHWTFETNGQTRYARSNPGGKKIFDFSCKEKGTEKSVLHLICKEPSLLLLAEMFLGTSTNPLSLDLQLKIPSQYVPKIYVSSRKLLFTWEKRTFFKHIRLTDADNFDVFSEFDAEMDFDMKSNRSNARSRDSEGVFLNLKSSLNSFQYTHAYCLPKTQTHKKFLSVFKPRQFSSLKSREERTDMNNMLEMQSTNEGGNRLPKRAQTQDLSDGQLLSKPSGETQYGKNMRKSTYSLQRIGQLQKGSKGFLVIDPPSKINIQSSAKSSKLGSIMSILKSKNIKKTQMPGNKNISTVEENSEKLEKAIDDLSSSILTSLETMKTEHSTLKYHYSKKAQRQMEKFCLQKSVRADCSDKYGKKLKRKFFNSY